MIKFENVSKVYEDGFQALKGLNLHIKEGELLVLIGPSGCGKTTTMKMINKLIAFTDGDVKINGNSIKKQNSVELRRDIGYVIQQIGLFPHMTIGQNVALVPKLKKENPEIYNKKVIELLNMVGLEPDTYLNRYPKELSGGQQQRVGVIRALASDPSIILMDEPFSALDPISREQLQDELVKLQDEIKKTIVFVTHDMDEALKIADRICIMQAGEVVQIDTPEKILRHPANEFVRNFIGETRLENAKNIELPPIQAILTKAITVKPTKGLAEAVKMLHKYHVDSLIVVDRENKLLGIASAWDIYKSYKNEDLTIQDIMKTDNVSIRIDRDLEEAMELIQSIKMGYLTVVDSEKRVQGVITNASLAELLYELNKLD